MIEQIVPRALVFRGHYKDASGGRGGAAIVSCGEEFRGDSLDVIFKWNRGEDRDWVDDVGFYRNDLECLDCGGLECNGVILRLECGGEGEDRGNSLMDTVTERLEARLEPEGDSGWPCYQV